MARVSNYVEQDAATNESGVILSVGIVVGGSPGAIVLPMICGDPKPSNDMMCESCIVAFETDGIVPLLACLAQEVYISHVQADGMVDGWVPSRHDYSTGTYIGTAVGNPASAQVAGLLSFYKKSMTSVTSKVKVAHNYISGIPRESIVNNVLDNGIQNKIFLFGYKLCGEGVVDGTTTPYTWKRYLSAPWEMLDGIRRRTPGLSVDRVAFVAARGYPATQRRRLVPHP